MELISSAIVFLLMTYGSVLAQTAGGAEGVMSVEGTAQVRIAPDLALVRLGIVEQSSRAAEAQRGGNLVAGAILEVIRGMGIEAS